MTKTAAEFKNIRNILVIKLRHIGDVLLTAPVFRALRETFPEARITALVNKGTEEVLAGHSCIDEIISYDRGIKNCGGLRKFSAEFGFLRDIRARRFDMTVDLTSGDRPAIISFASGARFRIAADPKKGGMFGKRHLYTHRAILDGSRHTVLQNLDVVRPFGIVTDNPAVDFFIPKAARESVRRLLDDNGIDSGDKVVHVHPTSRWLFKCWNDAAMADVIRWLLESGVKVVVTSSPDRKEMAKAEQVLSLVPSHRAMVTLLGKTTIKELAAISERADLFFGVDSAPMHIAAAVGTPVVALFGPSGAFHWGPWDNEAIRQWGQRNPYQNRNGVQSFGKHTVLQRGWECIPCGKDGCDGSKVSRCLEEMTVDEVIEILKEHLKIL
ncbi:MAG: putative lipopolysaccharide heptosyltransferase III [Geobacter sp.]|nr:putative lipopolysaccharide heptosyltransferase III [Geobacter sp.]